MDWHIQRFLNRLSLLICVIATVSLLHLFFHHSSSCFSSRLHLRHLASSFPSSSCDPALTSHRAILTPDARFKKITSTSAFKKRSNSFLPVIKALASLNLLSNSSRVLCLASGAGHDALAFIRSGVSDVTAVDLVEFPPLVIRSDPHNLPFFDEAFDLGFSAEIDSALFPTRFAQEMERTVRKGGGVAVVVDEREGVEELFTKSSLVEVRNFTLVGHKMSLIIFRKNGNSG